MRCTFDSMKGIKKVFTIQVFKIGGVLFFIYFLFCLPSSLFEQNYSKTLLDRNGKLLEARIAQDGQWRFPLIDSVPFKFEKCILSFEDKNFRKHPGVNPLAVCRALFQNFKHEKVVSGASTITMQTIRLLRKNKGRTIKEKLIEMIWATRLEIRLSKDEILKYYATHAPFGGNVVGLETASWRYFNRSPHQLSWAESAMLAVLPNAPGLIHLNKNRDALISKRNRLLRKMQDEGTLSLEEYNTATMEPLPKPLNALPHHAYHFINRINTAGRILSTLDFTLQNQLNQLTQQYSIEMKQKNIHNLSAVILDVKKGEVLAYVGNINKDNNPHSGKVDMMKSVRSSGSILKPMLYALATSEGVIAPKQLVPDYPMSFAGYRPTNYNPNFDGLVPANEALYRSLNVPAAWLLKEYGTGKFKSQLQKMGLTSINRPVSEYGLSLILGGAEVNLLELTHTYAAMANSLNTNLKTHSLFGTLNHKIAECTATIPIDKGSVYSTLNAITQTHRPETEAYWKNFNSGKKIAWKTGTSYGNRDAWAVGVTPDYAIGIWIGNSNGEGVAGLTGLNNAAPLLFQIVDVMPHAKWFNSPNDMMTLDFCLSSGMKASKQCPEKRKQMMPISTDRTSLCIYHQTYLVSKDQSNRVYKSNAEPQSALVSFMVLPPLISHYYKIKHPEYKELPPYLSSGVPHSLENNSHIQVLYPINQGTLSLPKTSMNEAGIAAKVFHSKKDISLFWEFNGQYIGTTNTLHEKIITPKMGKNKLTVTDSNGDSKQAVFEVI